MDNPHNVRFSDPNEIEVQSIIFVQFEDPSGHRFWRVRTESRSGWGHWIQAFSTFREIVEFFLQDLEEENRDVNTWE
jgi:hypothetical protein